MMKRTWTIFALCSLFAFCSLNAFGGEGAFDNAIRQLGRGCTNLLTGVLEVPANIQQVKEEEGDIAALTYGTLRGTYRFAVREVVGVFEIVTFPVGWKTIVHPEFGGAGKVLSEAYEPDMRNSVSASGQWRISKIERQINK